MQFSEADGFSHLHLHLVPRAADHPAEARGPRVFSLLSDDETAWLSPEDQDGVARAVRDALAAGASTGWSSLSRPRVRQD
jgi:diadenosine tetraphosphate (Ap4A) HIT family hydrolase